MDFVTDRSKSIFFLNKIMTVIKISDHGLNPHLRNTHTDNCGPEIRIKVFCNRKRLQRGSLLNLGGRGSTVKPLAIS